MPTVPLSKRQERVLLAVILLAYLLLGSAYAVLTPPWQAPDEPAHYNYVRYIVENGTLPALRAGDYPAAYLEEIKAARFAPEYAIDPIRYESHQPPLYYLLAAPAFALGRAAGMDTPLVPLRLFTVTLGLLSLLVAHALVRALAPRHRWLALGTVAFMAFLPMRLAVTSAVNNDVLVELILGLIVWQLVRMGPLGWSRRGALCLGLTVGLALLTKLQAYVAVPLVALAWARAAGTARRAERPLRPLVVAGALAAGVALLVVLPWLTRNMALYGASDPLGMVRHEAVATGQLTTAALVAEVGVSGTLQRLAQTTFQSFWGQFGWMGVPLPGRVYLALALVSGLALLGLLDAARHLSGAWRDDDRLYGILLLVAWAAFTLAGFAWYNLQYVQHQGRYLFPALVPWALGFTLGLQQLYARLPRWVLVLLGLATGLLLIWGLVRANLPAYALFLLLSASAGLILAHAVERRRQGVALAGTFAAMAGLAAWSLTVLVPLLSP